MHSKVVRTTVPDFFEDREPPVISYRYTKTIGPSIFNFRKVGHDEIDDPPCSSCSCNQSPLLYHPSGHVTTGDLRIRNSESF